MLSPTTASSSASSSTAAAAASSSSSPAASSASACRRRRRLRFPSTGRLTLSSARRPGGGAGDAGDEWEVMVREPGDTYDAGWGGPWLRDSVVRFKHVVTGQYLFSHRKQVRALCSRRENSGGPPPPPTGCRTDWVSVLLGQFNNGPVDGMSEITCSPRADDR